MATRFYKLAKLMTSNTTPSSYTIDGVAYSLTVNGSTRQMASPYYAMDGSDSTAWYDSFYNRGTSWYVLFGAPFLVYDITITYYSGISVGVQAYNGTSWVYLTTLSSGSATVTLHDIGKGTKYYGINLYTGASTGVDNFSISNVEFTFCLNSDVQTFFGVDIADSEDVGNISITGNSGLDIEDLSNGPISLLNYNGLDVEIDTIKSGGRTTRSYQSNDDETLQLLNARQNGKNGSNLDDYSFGLRASSTYGEDICNLNFGNRRREDFGMPLDDEVAGLRIRSDLCVTLDDNLAGVRTRNDLGFAIDDESIGREVRNVIGVGLDDCIVSSSNANSRYILTVTPTHQHKSMPVTVSLTSRSTEAISGKYNLTLNDSVIVQQTSSDIAMNNVEFTINPSQLTKGINKARIKLFYPNGEEEYLDFEIVKEEIKRTTAQRLFRNYDGGFTGDIYAPPKILIPSTYPCWMPPNNAVSGVVKTTDYTRISLLHYTGVQGVSVVGNNLNILVSFDKGVTWKSFISNVWTTVDISNIKTYGMAVATINAITIAQWSDTFAPMSIDFAICLNNDLNTVTTLKSYSLTPTLDGTWESFSGQHVTYISDAKSSTSGDGNYLNYRTIYSSLYPDGYTVQLSTRWWTSPYTTYTVSDGEIIYSINYYKSSNGTASVAYTHIVNGYTLNAYLKSITVNMTPSTFTGYALII